MTQVKDMIQTGSGFRPVYLDGSIGGVIDPPYRWGETVAMGQSYLAAGYKFVEMLEHKRIIIENPSTGERHEVALAGWNNKMFVLPGLMPTTLFVESVRPERLQQITPEGCYNEGIDTDSLDPIWEYSRLIDYVSKQGTWDSNPLVWRIRFFVIDKLF